MILNGQLLHSDSIKCKTFVIDIDGTLCSNTDGDYESAKPIPETIAGVQKIFENGGTVVLFTARGSTTGKNWEKVTTRQLDSWGVPYHRLLFGKPFGDYYIDDKALSPEALIQPSGA